MAAGDPEFSPFPILVIGGSAGSIQVINELLIGLPGRLGAAVLAVVHQGQSSPGFLPQSLSRRTPFPAAHAREGEEIQPGRLYVAPVDHHLLVDPGQNGDLRVKLARGPKENRFRPAVDPLFRTAARAGGRRVIGVVLSGMLDDGTLGLMHVKSHGGRTIVQDPDDAECPDMPASALRNVNVDFVLKSDQMAIVIERLVEEMSAPGFPAGVAAMSESIDGGRRRDPDKGIPDTLAGPEPGVLDVAERGDAGLTNETLTGPPSALTCPSCGGAIWEQRDGSMVHFRCHVGHRYAAESFAAEQSSLLESTLWAALRMFEEKASFNKRMLKAAEESGDTALIARLRERVEESRSHTEVIRNLLLHESRR